MPRNLRRISRRTAGDYRAYVRRLYAQCAEDTQKLTAAYHQLAPLSRIYLLRQNWTLHHRKLCQEFRNCRQDIHQWLAESALEAPHE